MRSAVTILCVLGFCAAINFSSPLAAKTFGDWSAPVNVGPPLNTPYNDNYAVLSADQLTMYFTSNRPGSLGGDDLWFATRATVDSVWEEPQNMTTLNSGFADSLPFLSPNEHVLYFYSERPSESCGKGDIWMTSRKNKHSDWIKPSNLGCVLNTGDNETAPAFFEDPSTEQSWLFYGSDRRPGIGDFDVYASPLSEGRLAGPGILVTAFSSPARDTRIFIRKDGLEAFITSNREHGQGLLDIWTTTRETPSDEWPQPVDLEVPLNSTYDEGSPWLSKDGTTLYFFSTRPVGGYDNKRDIWYATRPKLRD